MLAARAAEAAAAEAEARRRIVEQKHAEAEAGVEEAVTLKTVVGAGRSTALRRPVLRLVERYGTVSFSDFAVK